ncbi:MAG: diguanylate cyclase [Gammaproteobacteria bacterium]|nr:diguanylate cyclase [Gammaproteobacteria bacterium]NNF61185.1 diguanylate cyclase [Gammaproteobacteria bacterium]NNM19880.1 diguanylate cyclase [Gammaproteobacteria bacterium]
MPAVTETAVSTELLVERWMSRDPECVGPDTALEEVASLMGIRRHSCIVVTEGHKAIGLISERDLVRELARALGGKSAEATAGAAMSQPVICIAGHETVDAAVKLMTDHRIRRLVVTDEEDEIVGVLTQSDLMRANISRADMHRRTLEAQVATRTAELETAVEQLEALARVDPLMNIGNRRSMDEALAMAHQRSLRYRRTYSVILLDVDKFKSYNDSYGHPRGDRVLRDIAGEVLACARVLDRPFRYGGEEILVLLPETDGQGTVAVAERVRRAVVALDIEHRGSTHGVVTISAGVATSVPRKDGSVPAALDLLAAADRSLYEAKGAGRNRLGPVYQPD